MATIQKTKTSKGEERHRVFVRIKGAQPVSRTFKSLETAKKWAKATEVDIERGESLQQAANHTLKELIDGYQDDIDHRDPSTGQRLAWWREHYGQLNASRFTRQNIKAALRSLSRMGPKGKPLSAASVNRYHSSLSGAFKWALEEGWVKENPATNIRRGRESDGFGQWLETPEQRRSLLDACNQSDWSGLRVIVTLALVTGARRGELSSLRWDDVDFTKGRATARDTKNGSDNVMALPASLVAMLREWKLQCGSAEYVFQKDGKPFYEWQRHWDIARKAAGLPELRFHSLRHSAASIAVENGATDRQVAELLNHKTLAMVQRYSHVRDAVTRGISEQIADGLI